MGRLSQLKSDPVAVVGSNLAKCGDTVLVAFFIGFLFFGAERFALRHGVDPQLVTPFSEVIEGQLDLLSVAVFFSVVVFYAGCHLILANIGWIKSVMNFIGVGAKMDVFYLFVLQYIAAAVGVRCGMTLVKLVAGGPWRDGLLPTALLAASALILIGIWYVKDAGGRMRAFPLGILLILFAAALYLSLAFPSFRNFAGG